MGVGEGVGEVVGEVGEGERGVETLISLGFDDCHSILPVYTTFTHRREHVLVHKFMHL